MVKRRVDFEELAEAGEPQWKLDRQIIEKKKRRARLRKMQRISKMDRARNKGKWDN